MEIWHEGLLDAWRVVPRLQVNGSTDDKQTLDEDTHERQTDT